MRADHMDVQTAFAEAYCESAHASADMRSVTNALETIRDSLSGDADPFATWGIINDHLGRADLERFAPSLLKLRDQYEQSVTAQQLAALNRAFERDVSSGWNRWVVAYVQTFSDWIWHGRLGLALAQQALPAVPNGKFSLEQVREQARLSNYGRWSEIYDWALFLSQQALPAEQRARMLVIAAEIQLYHFYQPSKAKQLLEQAASLDADGRRVLVGWGEYWQQQGNVEQRTQARDYFERVLRTAPYLADGYVNLGDYYDAVEKNPSETEDQYQQAIQNAPGMADGYRRLMNYYGRTDLFKDHQDRLAPLIERIKLLDEDQFTLPVEIGIIYKNNRRYDDAIRYFQQALQVDPEYILAYDWLGYTYLEQANDPQADPSLYARAGAAFAKVIELAPTALDGYWGMAGVAMQQGNWQAALDWCERSLQCHPEWESFVFVRRGNVLRELGRFADAEQALLRSLTLEPDNPTALDELTTLADQYKTNESREVALRALASLRRFKGEAHEHIYQNKLGNIQYYYGDYAAAADLYRKAIAAKPDDDVLHSNLALALEKKQGKGTRMEELDEAIAELQRARELNASDTSYGERLSKLEADRRFLAAYGEAALAFEPWVLPIRIELQNAALKDLLNAEQTELSEATLARASQLRARVFERFGVSVPSMRFSELTGPDAYTGEYKINIREQPVESGLVEPGERFAHSKADTGDAADGGDPEGYWLSGADAELGDDAYEVWSAVDYLFSHIQRALESRLADLLGHQETAELLDRCASDACTAIRKSPQELTPFVHVLRQLLSKRAPLNALDQISADFQRLRSAAVPLDQIPDQLGARASQAPTNRVQAETPAA